MATGAPTEADAPVAKKFELDRPFDFDGRKGDAIAGLQHLIGWGRLAIDTDQKVRRFALRHFLAEQSGDGRSFGDFDVVRKAAAVAIDEQDAHG